MPDACPKLGRTGRMRHQTTAVDEQPAATHPRNYDTAWDWYSTDTGMANTDNVITLYNNAGLILDAVFVSDNTLGTAAGGFVDDDFNQHAAQDLNATGTSPAGESIQRDDDDNDDKDDWTQAASSWGLRNTGQTIP